MTVIPAPADHAPTSLVRHGAATTPRDPVWSRLTMSRRKWRFYRDEPGFMAAHACLLAEFGIPVIDALQRHAIALMKPEAWLEQLFPRVEHFLARNGFQIVELFRTELSPVVSREIWRYSWNVGPVERVEVSELILGLGPTYGLLLRDTRPSDEIASAVRLARLKGPALPERQGPGHLRYELGAPNRIVSYVHIPDEPADIIRDLSLLLGRREMLRVLSRTLEPPLAPLAIDLDALDDVAQIDDTRPPAAPIGTPFDALVRRIQCMGTVLAKCVADDGRYHIPRALWRHVIDLCTDVAALPTFGKKRLEPLANIG